MWAMTDPASSRICFVVIWLGRFSPSPARCLTRDEVIGEGGREFDFLAMQISLVETHIRFAPPFGVETGCTTILGPLLRALRLPSPRASLIWRREHARLEERRQSRSAPGVERRLPEFFRRIDAYDREGEYGPEDPSDPNKTLRVLTLMLAEDY